MYLSNRHKEVEDEFRKLKDGERTPGVYVAMCKSAKIRDSAIENRLSALELFKKQVFGAAKDAKSRRADESKAKPDDDESKDPEAAARSRLERQRRAWDEEYEDVEKAK